MDEDLQQLVSELRKETCPQRVLDEVARRISEQTEPPNRFRYAIATALAALVVLCGIGLWRWPRGGGSGPQHVPELAQNAPIGREEAARQASGALAYIGQVLLEAGAHSERVILNDAVPQVRNSLETARNKIMNHTEL